MFLIADTSASGGLVQVRPHQTRGRAVTIRGHREGQACRSARPYSSAFTREAFHGGRLSPYLRNAS